MTVINNSALAYHHFKHFDRLVGSSLDPLPLEPANPDVITRKRSNSKIQENKSKSDTIWSFRDRLQVY